MSSHTLSRIAALALALPALPALAQADTALPGGGAVLVRTALGLLVVIALIFACAWAARRFGFASRATGAIPMKVLSTLTLGPRERIVMLEVDDTWLVLGVNPGGINTLHVMPAKPGAATAGAPIPPDLASSFRQVLRHRLGKTAMPAAAGDHPGPASS